MTCIMVFESGMRSWKELTSRDMMRCQAEHLVSATDLLALLNVASGYWTQVYCWRNKTLEEIGVSLQADVVKNNQTLASIRGVWN